MKKFIKKHIVTILVTIAVFSGYGIGLKSHNDIINSVSWFGWVFSLQMALRKDWKQNELSD